MKNILLAAILFLSGAAAAQKDTLAKYSISELLDKSIPDISNSKIYAEELLHRNPSDSIKIRALDIISDYYILTAGDFDSANSYFKKSLALAKKINYTEYIIICLSRLSTYHAVLNKNEEALKYLSELKQYHFIEDYNTYGHEGYVYFLMGDIEKTVFFDKKMLREAKNAAKEKGMTKKKHEEIQLTIKAAYAGIATSYNYLKKLDSASFYINKAEEIKIEANNVTWFIKAFNLILRRDFDGAIACMDKNYDKYIKNYKIDKYQYLYYMAICYQQKGDFKKGLEFSKEAIKNKTPMISFQNYELECYKIAAECAEKLGKTDEAFLYNKKYSEVSEKMNYAKKAAFMAKLYEQNEVSPLKKEIAIKSSRAAMLFWGLGFASILAGYLIFRIAKSRKEKKKFLAIIERLENKESIEIAPVEIEEPILIDIEEEEEISSKKNISLETETKILKKLENFERRQRFLEPNISLGTLALDFKTNTTYITYVIKKHKNENLINYINKLRIEYIIQKMASDPEYANYKIEYLAQESGFASYSTFKRIFTKETGIDPSKFINYLKQATKE